MARHLHLVSSGSGSAELEVTRDEPVETTERSNVVDLAVEREKRRERRFHPSAGRGWMEDLFDDDGDLDPAS